MVRQLEYHLKDGTILNNINGKIISIRKKESYFHEEIILHRLDGPAVLYPSGYQAYWVYGIRHRSNGPAIIYSDGSVLYYYFGKRVSENEFNELKKQCKKIYISPYLFDKDSDIRNLFTNILKDLDQIEKL